MRVIVDAQIEETDELIVYVAEACHSLLYHN